MQTSKEQNIFSRISDEKIVLILMDKYGIKHKPIKIQGVAAATRPSRWF